MLDYVQEGGPSSEDVVVLWVYPIGETIFGWAMVPHFPCCRVPGAPLSSYLCWCQWGTIVVCRYVFVYWLAFP